ncbi:matrix protein [Achimota virus 1]|uniref:Matrix protein n=1 Tax=Achimota virus 1 TaxID=1261100 RepID=K7XBD3_9MONO|nr:matrix protein [Achimota virus 1]AFX75107.1 matrix protein [Achimota virus 1]
MAHRQASVSLKVDPVSEKNHLRPFPIVQVTPDSGNGRGRLMKQIRIKDLTPAGSTEPPITFVNTYGFVKPLRTRSEFFSEFHRPDSSPSITACTLPFGAGPNIDHPMRLLEEIEKCHIVMRKSASLREEVVYTIQKLPPILAYHQIASQKLICVPSEKYLKAPSKMQSGVDYTYCISFLSIVYCPPSLKFRVLRPLQMMRSSTMRSIQIEVLLEVDCDDSSPATRFLIRDEATQKWRASVWFHLCNIIKSHQGGDKYDDHYFNDKCRKMDLEVGIIDMWGPTFLVKAHGRVPKSAKVYFSQKNWACHPLVDAAPALSKILWSVGASIVQVNAILQPSDLNQLAQFSDVIYPKVKINRALAGSPPSKWNPVKKAVLG